jgi:hypothetical protein
MKFQPMKRKKLGFLLGLKFEHWNFAIGEAFCSKILNKLIKRSSNWVQKKIKWMAWYENGWN